MLVNAGPWLPVPPDGYGGIETVVATLVPELRAAGVGWCWPRSAPSTLEVDHVVAPLGEPRASRRWRRRTTRSRASRTPTCTRVLGCCADHEVDLVHDHLEVVGPAVLGAAGDGAPPTLQTLHWDLRKHPDFYEHLRRPRPGALRGASRSRSSTGRRDEAAAQTLGVVPLAVPPPVPH